MRAVEVDAWCGRSVAGWRERWGVPALRVFRRVGSTNDVAAAMARDGAGEHGLVLADQQTAGRGRRGRRWVAPPEVSLSISMVLRPASAQLGLLTLRLGLAAADAVDAVAGTDLALKWPNDLLVAGDGAGHEGRREEAAGGRKVGGILCEAESRGDRVAHVIAGVGINLADPADGWPDGLRHRATSLAAAGAAVDAAELVGAVVERWRAADGRVGPLSPEEREAFDRRDALRGRDITVDGGLAGTAAGVTPDGALRVVTERGEHAIFSGTVRIQSQQGQRP